MAAVSIVIKCERKEDIPFILKSVDEKLSKDITTWDLLDKLDVYSMLKHYRAIIDYAQYRLDLTGTEEVVSNVINVQFREGV